jgi:hypothetical protein
VLSGRGHTPFVERPDELAKLILGFVGESG